MSNSRLALRGAGGTQFLIHGPTLTIGRDPRNDVVINNKKVSRRHATMRVGDTGLEIADDGSANGTFLNGHRLERPTRLRIGDELRIGEERFILEAVAQQHSPVAVPVYAPQPVAGVPVVARTPSRRVPVVPLLAAGAVVVVAALALVIFLNRSLQPDEAAKAWLEALAAQDVRQLSDLTCMSQQNAIQATSLVVGVGGLLGSSLDVGSVRYQTARSDGSAATVHLSGTVKASLGPISTGRRLELDVQMRNESGKWRFCDNLQRIASQISQ